MSVVSAKIKSRKEKENKMKMSKFARQNFILLALSGIFALITNAGVNDIAKNGVEGFGMFAILIGGLATIASLVTLVVRLWEMD
jgi:anaerobic C4-dicarboxylate transporter